MEIPVTTTQGAVSKIIETESAKIPKDYSLWVGLGLLGASILFRVLKRKHAGLYIAQLATPLLISGVYNTLIKKPDQSNHLEPGPSPKYD